jgi:hypothetical protein
MADSSQDENESQPLMIRYGHQCYEKNPSLASSLPMRIKSKASQNLGDAYVVTRESGEILANGSIGLILEEEVDSERFVKVYLEGVKKYAQLSRPGARIFEFVYEQLKDAKDKDQILISYALANKWQPDISRRTYSRGLSELLDKEFVFRTLANDVYFVNVRYIFNGNRLIVANAYQRIKEIG